MPYSPAHWRLLLSPLADGSTNMALDEALLASVAAGEEPPTLRFFRWSPPCLSLGYAQPAGEADPERLRRFGFDLVRRPTGGRAILHTDELTYSLAAPADEERVHGGVVESYRHLSAGLRRGLEHLGLEVRADKEYSESEKHAAAARGPVCFEVPSNYEITAGKKKLVGSAQVRKQGGVLQHGTLPLIGDVARICEGLKFASEAERQAAQARVRERATTVAEVLQREVSWDEAAAALARGFAEALNLTLDESPLSSKELELAEKLREEKYAAQGWNYRV
jgi:lipoate-protein ligase A